MDPKKKPALRVKAGFQCQREVLLICGIDIILDALYSHGIEVF